MKDFFRSLIYDNLPLKLLSIVLALLFWSMARGYFGK